MKEVTPIEPIWKPEQQKQREAEWSFAQIILAGKPPGSEMHSRHTTQLVTAHPKKEEYGPIREIIRNEGQLHKFIKGHDNNIYVVKEKKLGGGSFFEVFYCEDVDGTPFAIKVASGDGLHRSKYYTSPDVERKNIDLGARKGFTVEDEKPLDGNTPKKYFAQVHRYAGMTLSSHLKTNQELTKDKQYDLAIKITRSVHYLHSGKVSKTKKKYAHLDLKPDNICIDKDGNVQLIDFDFAEIIGQDNYGLQRIKGTPAYMHKDIKIGMEREVLDIFALLRTLYLPQKFFCRRTKGTEMIERRCARCVFTDGTIQASPSLENILNTQNGCPKTESLTAINLTCRLILLRQGIYTNENLNKSLKSPDQFSEYYKHLEKVRFHGDETLNKNKITELIEKSLNDPSRLSALETLSVIRQEIIKKLELEGGFEAGNYGKEFTFKNKTLTIPHGIHFILTEVNDEKKYLEDPIKVLNECKKKINQKSESLSLFRCESTTRFYRSLQYRITLAENKNDSNENNSVKGPNI